MNIVKILHDLFFKYKLKNNLCHIVTVDKNNVIGVRGSMFKREKEDLDLLRRLTHNNIIVFDSITWRSVTVDFINTIIIVISKHGVSNIQNRIPDMVVDSIVDIEKLYITHKHFRDKKVYIIGSDEIYNITKHLVKYAYVSHIPNIVEMRHVRVRTRLLSEQDVSILDTRLKYDMSYFTDKHKFTSKMVAFLKTDNGSSFITTLFTRKKTYKLGKNH